MGREIRRVPPDWQHPTKECDCLSGFRQRHSEYDLPGGRAYVPLYNEDYDTARAKWLEGLRRWEAGESWDFMTDTWRPRRDYETGDFWEHDSPPDRDLHRPSWPAGAATAYQVYETVSEGTPISPVCPTREALIDWLVNDGFGMGIEPRTLRLSREAAEAFIEAGSAPSMVMDSKGLRDGVLAVTDRT